VNRDIFPERVVVPDFRARHSAFPLQVLRLQPEAREWKNFVSLPQLGVPVNDHVRMQPAPRAQYDVFANDAIRPDFAIRSDLRLGMDNGRRVNH
jgi:hypothetical protein